MRFLWTRPEEYELIAIERELERVGYRRVEQPLRKISTRCGNVLGQMGLLARWSPWAAEPLVVVGGNLPMREFVPYGFVRPLILWRYDVWQPDYLRWEQYLTLSRTPLAFFTAKQAAEELGRRVPGCECVWLPECVSPEEYLPTRPLASRQIDVLELGRKYDLIHNQIQRPLEAAGKRHLYERIKGIVIYPEKQQMVDGLADARVVLCYPSSMTHPERSGNVETLTHRYLQAMASGAVVVGKAPSELVEIFGYNPVVEFKTTDVAKKLLEILDNIAQYTPLVERNLARVKEVATTQLRVAQLTALLWERGYKAPSVHIPV
jgi:glycosyltransferase involved in cell wall biosynthesis